MDGYQNLLRFWANVAHLPDFVYDIADGMGILLWSESEFEDDLHPFAEAFLDNVLTGGKISSQKRSTIIPRLLCGLRVMNSRTSSFCLQQSSMESRDGGREYEQLFWMVLLPAVNIKSKSISYIPSNRTNGYLTLDFSLSIQTVE